MGEQAANGLNQHYTAWVASAGAYQQLTVIPAMSEESRAMVQRLTDASRQSLEQYPFVTQHRLHAGMYARTVTIPAPADASALVTGVLVKRTTMLIICGDVDVFMGAGLPPRTVAGQEVFMGSAGRKQAFRSRGPFTMTMLFATDAKTVAEAEAEFTDEVELLCPLSETDRHDILVGEPK